MNGKESNEKKKRIKKKILIKNHKRQHERIRRKNKKSFQFVRLLYHNIFLDSFRILYNPRDTNKHIFDEINYHVSP